MSGSDEVENKTFAIRSQASAEDIIKIRKRLSLTQQRLADFMNVSKNSRILGTKKRTNYRACCHSVKDIGRKSRFNGILYNP